MIWATRLLWGVAGVAALLVAVGVYLDIGASDTASTPDRELTEEDQNRSVDIMRNRVDKLGVSEPEIRTQGRPTLTEASASGYPDRVYLLQLPSPRALESGDVAVTENGAPVGREVRIKTPDSGTAQIGTKLSSEYIVTYRSLLPPDQKVVVTAKVDGVGRATASYTTPHIDLESTATFAANSEESWTDEVITPLFLMVLVVIAALALLVFARAR